MIMKAVINSNRFDVNSNQLYIAKQHWYSCWRALIAVANNWSIKYELMKINSKQITSKKLKK